MKVISVGLVAAIHIVLNLAIAFGQNVPAEFLWLSDGRADSHAYEKGRRLETKEGHVYFTTSARGNETQVHDIDLTEMVNVIVEFRTVPLFLQKKQQPRVGLLATEFESLFLRFSQELQTIHSSLLRRISTNLSQPRIQRKFYKAFTGVSVIVPRAAIPELLKLNYVKRIHLDKQMQAFLEDTVPLIRADSVWQEFGTQGDSIVVGILDTGIDYHHSALGGGFGPGHKIIGGYDLVNDDGDPMDDNGHGTAVAGIVAANSDTLKGVAPGAWLMAFKVLNADGLGTESDVIAGIERALDPNDDDDFSDKVDVVNMSLGGRGNPDDAISTTVDNAVKLGIVFCVAAGNSYEYNTIASPGTARLAITVGATTKTDQIAAFSSKGPTLVTHAIKPDVVAPGVGVNTTTMGSGTQAFNGTSAATPHVAGVCALLKKIHPEWPPDKAKSALMTTAVDVRAHVMAQGAGRIDALAAARAKVFAVPSHLSYGLDDVGYDNWTASDTITVFNQSPEDQEFAVSVTGLRPGILLEASSSRFRIPSGDSQQVVLTLMVENDRVPYLQREPLAYAGTVFVNGSIDTLRLPWAFVKSSKVLFTFDEPFDYIVLASRDISHLLTYNPNRSPEIFTAPGIYDLVAVFGLPDSVKIVIHENLAISGFMNVEVNSSEAKHRIDFQGVDPMGRLLFALPAADYRVNYCVTFPDSSANAFTYGSIKTDHLFVSDFSNRFVIVTGQFQRDSQPFENIHVVQFPPLIGADRDMVFSNSPNDFILQHLNIKYPPKTLDPTLYVLYLTRIFRRSGYAYFGGAAGEHTFGKDEWTGNLYLTPDAHEDYGTTVMLSGYDQKRVANNLFSGMWLETDPLVFQGDSLGNYTGIDPWAAVYFSPNRGEMTYGMSPIHTDGFLNNNFYGQSNIAAFPKFYGPLNERRFSDIYRSTYTIFNSRNILVASDTLSKFSPINVPPGPYRLEVSNRNYYVGNLRGTASLISKFDLSKRDANPPLFTSLRVLDSEGRAISKLQPGKVASLVYSAADFVTSRRDQQDIMLYEAIPTDSTRLWYREFGTTDWHEMAIHYVLEDSANAGVQPLLQQFPASSIIGFPAGKFFKADFASFAGLDSAAIDIRIEIRDQSGNASIWTLEPAFAIGDFATSVSLESEPATQTALPQRFALYPSYPNPFNPSTIITFDLPSTERVTIKIYDALGREIKTLLDETRKPGRYRIAWNGLTDEKTLAASGVYICQIRAGQWKASQKLLLLR